MLSDQCFPNIWRLQLFIRKMAETPAIGFILLFFQYRSLRDSQKVVLLAWDEDVLWWRTAKLTPLSTGCQMFLKNQCDMEWVIYLIGCKMTIIDHLFSNLHDFVKTILPGVHFWSTFINPPQQCFSACGVMHRLTGRDCATHIDTPRH